LQEYNEMLCWSWAHLQLFLQAVQEGDGARKDGTLGVLATRILDNLLHEPETTDLVERQLAAQTDIGAIVSPMIIIIEGDYVLAHKMFEIMTATFQALDHLLTEPPKNMPRLRAVVREQGHARGLDDEGVQQLLAAASQEASAIGQPVLDFIAERLYSMDEERLGEQLDLDDDDYKITPADDFSQEMLIYAALRLVDPVYVAATRPDEEDVDRLRIFVVWMLCSCRS
jgi:hypothetical protein